MTAKLLEKKVNSLSREVASLRAAFFATAAFEKDPEGEYRPEFVRRVLASVSKKDRGIPFTNERDFLKEIGR